MSPSTVARWLVQLLSMTYIDTEVFKGHSTRSASSSMVEVTGVSLTHIIKQGHWFSNISQAFQIFLRINIKEYASNFQSEFLSKPLWREGIRVIASSFSSKRRVAVLDRPVEILRSEIQDYMRAQNTQNIISISQGTSKARI